MKFLERSRSAALAVILITAGGVVGTDSARAQSANGGLRASVSLASDFVQYGLSQLRSDASVRVGIDFETDRGWFAGGSLANVEYDAEIRFAKPRDSQLLAYAGYVWRGRDWTSNVTVSRYIYPDIVRSYDYTQFSVTVSYRDRYFLTASRNSDYLAVYEDADDIRAGVAVPWVGGLEFGANAGRFRSEGRFGASYSYWDIGLSRAAGRFALDLRFHDNTYGSYSLLGNQTSDLWVFSATYALLPRRRFGN